MKRRATCRGARVMFGLAATLSISLAIAGTATAGAVTSHRTWQLDGAFGNGGIVQTDFPVSGAHYSWGLASVVQPDGHIIVAGVASSQVTQNDSLAVARYLPNGQLDSSFGGDGRILIGSHPLYRATAVALQEVNGQSKILVAVRTTFFDPTRYRCSVVRLNPDGTLDTDHDADPGVVFGHEGIKVVAFPANSGFCGGMVVDPDGKILVDVEAASHGGDVGVFRLLAADGSLDPGFGTDGKVTVSAGGYQVPTAVALQEDSGGQPRILIGGLEAVQAGYDWALWRLTSDGRLDSTFGDDGSVVTPMRDPRVERSYDTVDALAVTPSGAIIASGRYRAWPKGELLPEDTAAVAKYSPDGALDPTFGHLGVAHIPWDSRGEAEALGVTLDDQGRILFAGPFEMPTSGQFLVGGFLANGQPDPRFGPSGYLEFYVRGGYDAAYALALGPHGRLVVAGIAGDPSSQGRDLFAVTRFRLSPAGL